MSAGASPGPPAARADPDLWVAVGIVGVIVFLIGIYQPALGRLPYPGVLETAVAVAGAATAVLGFTYAQRARAARGPVGAGPAANPLMHLGPSIELYDPRTAVERPPMAEDVSEETVEAGAR